MKALKLCKGVLGMDKNNYDALVIAGEACSRLLQAQLLEVSGEGAGGRDGGPDWMEQSEKAFAKACDVEPNRIDAWQGMTTLYKDEGAWHALISSWSRSICNRRFIVGDSLAPRCRWHAPLPPGPVGCCHFIIFPERDCDFLLSMPRVPLP